jgi:hypothetical protein
MTASSPRYAGLSLTDELAEATNDLLSLGRKDTYDSRSTASIDPPLLTPSPLNLSTAGATLSSILAVGSSSKLILIHEDDDDESSPSRASNKCGPRKVFDPNAPFDADDDLPPCQFVAPVPYSTQDDSASSLRLKSKKEKANGNSPGMTTSHNFDEETSPRATHTPTFFTESFPEAIEERPSAGASGSDNKMDKMSTPTSLLFAISEPPPPTLGSIGEDPVIVKLHGNGRLEREAQDRMKVDEEDSVLPTSQSTEIVPNQTEEGDRSSLLSLAATAMTSSSQASSKGRRRMIRRRSGGSTSIVAEDLDTMEDAPFARDVQIRGFTVVGEKSRGFVCYDVRVITIRGTTISILRRFSSFCQLRQSLLSERPQHANLVPSLPPRRTGLFQKYASHHLEKRRRALQKWLAVVMLDQRWATTKSLREWVVGSSDEM